MIWIFHIIDLVIAIVEPPVHILMTTFDHLVWSLTQRELVFPDVIRDMIYDNVTLICVGHIKHLMQDEHIDFKLLDN